jgi:hypothetical protein
MRDAYSTQESGVLSSSGGPYFGPATKDSYDPSKWALIPTSVATEILLDPDPSERRRIRGPEITEPVFMKPLPSNDPLPGLITILAALPPSREALGGGEPTLEDYGSNPEWWKGTKISLSRVVHEDSVHLQPSFEIVEETQRLIAFLHNSNRSYGSVEPLSELRALSDVQSGQVEFKTLADRFLRAWSNASALLDRNYSSLFLTKALTLSPDGMEDELPFWAHEIKLDLLDDAAPARTLYDGVDGMLWAADEDGSTENNYCLKEIPDVLVMRVINQNGAKSELQMDVPETWYLDRYLRENMDMAKSMRRDRYKFKQDLQSIEDRRKKFTHITRPQGGKDGKITSKDLFTDAIEYLNPTSTALPIDEDEDEDEAPDIPIEPRCIELAKELAAVYGRVEQKLKGNCRLSNGCSPAHTCRSRRRTGQDTR